MTWGVGLGVAAALAAVWAIWERQRVVAARAQLLEQGRLIAARSEELLALEGALAAARAHGVGLEAALAEASDRASAQGAAAARMSAAAAQRDAALTQAKLSAREASAALVQREAALEEARASAAEAERAHRDALDALRAQLFSARRTLAAVSAERDRLAEDLGAAQGVVASAEAVAQEREALASRLTAAEAELARVHADTSRAPTRAWIARLSELERASEALRGEAERWQVRALDAERALGELGTAQAATQRDALRERLQRAEGALAQSATQRRALVALGLPELPRDAAILSGERRGRTEAILRETYIATQSAAGAILDERGATWARCGNPAVIERLAATVSLAARAPVATALGQAPRLFSELFGVYGRHRVTLANSGLSLAVTGSRECPALALRLAALKLTGASVAEPAAEGEAPPPLALDPQRSERLDAWAVRRGAVGVAAFGHGDPAGTDSAFAGACLPLVKTVQGLFNRASRDGFGQGFAAIWRGESDETLVARVLDDGATVVFARFPSPPSPRVLDDLAATLRWAAPPLAAAS